MRRPPSFAVRLLRACLGPTAFEVVAGDLDEEFARGRSGAWYWRQAFKSACAHLVGRALSGLAAFAHDVRLAARTLARQRRLALVATTTLGFGVALSLSVLAGVNAYLIRGLPYPDSDRLHNVNLFRPGVDMPQGLEELDWSSLNDLLDLQISWDLDLFNLRGAPYTEAAQGTWVTPGYMEGFGIRTALGRVFRPDDYAPGSQAVAIISHRLWQSRFGGDVNIVGRHFESYSNDRPDDIGVFTIVGVLPEGHWHIQQAFTDVLAPLRAPSYPYVVRARTGVTSSMIAGRVTALVRARHSLPDTWSADVVSAREGYVTTVKPLLLTLATGAALVLLIAAANVAVLLLVRANERRQEMAVRKALGATAARIVRVIVAEAVVLGVAAGAVGLAAAYALIGAMAPMVGRQLGRAVPGGVSALQIDGVVWAGALAAAVFIVLVCSVFPAWAAARGMGALSLSAGQKGSTGGHAQQRARLALVAAEVGACLALLIAATLMVQSSVRILNTDVGLSMQDILTSRISVRQASYPDAASWEALLQRITDETDGLPDLEGLAFAGSFPLQAAPEREVRSADRTQIPRTRSGLMSVSANYFDLLGIPLVDGRRFTPADRAGQPPVIVASRTLAERLWPGQRAVGQRLEVSPSPRAPAGTAPTIYEVVGVAADTRFSHADTDMADLYTPMSQSGSLSPFVYVRSARPEIAFDQFRGALTRIDEGLVAGSWRPLADILDQQRAGARFLAQLLAVFSGLAVVLALVGIHGVTAYAAGQRRREVAIRLAIGATRGHITALFLRQGLVMIGLGLTAGLAGALALGRLLRSQLFGVEPNDPVVMFGALTAFGVCALLASLGPARRAAQGDPSEALKS